MQTRLKDVFRDFVLYGPLMPKAFRRIIVKQKFRYHRREPTDAGEKGRNILKEYNTSLIVIHFAGGFGSAELIQEAQQYQVPYLIFNHFSNDWFNRVGIRQQIEGAAGTGGVSSVAIPRHIRSHYTSLLDGIDTDFYCSDRVPASGRPEKGFIILLPARITTGKGHFDLLRVASRLIKVGTDLKIIFAGREDSRELKNELIDFAKACDLGRYLSFTGHLGAEQMRECYVFGGRRCPAFLTVKALGGYCSKPRRCRSR